MSSVPWRAWSWNYTGRAAWITGAASSRRRGLAPTVCFRSPGMPWRIPWPSLPGTGSPWTPERRTPRGMPCSPAWRQGPTWQSPGMRKPTIRPSPSWRPFRAKTRRPGQRWRRWRFIPSCKSVSLRLRQPPPRPGFPASHPGCPRRGRTGRGSAYWACLAWASSAGPS